MTTTLRISAEVYVALEQIRRSGETNMLDLPVVHHIAHRRRAYAAVVWLEENPETYQRGVFAGFAPDRPLTPDEEAALEEAY